MSVKRQPGPSRPSWAVALATVLLVQSTAAIFFLADVVADLWAAPAAAHSVVEALVVAALLIGVLLSVLQLRAAFERFRDQERTIEAARGELSRTIRDQFGQWGLTPAESDVGFLALKGLDVAEIAGMRGSAEGTVRAQLTRIYAKAGVSGRAQFAAWFVEDLLGEALADPGGVAVPNAED